MIFFLPKSKCSDPTCFYAPFWLCKYNCGLSFSIFVVFTTKQNVQGRECPDFPCSIAHRQPCCPSQCRNPWALNFSSNFVHQLYLQAVLRRLIILLVVELFWWIEFSFSTQCVLGSNSLFFHSLDEFNIDYISFVKKEVDHFLNRLMNHLQYTWIKFLILLPK